MTPRSSLSAPIYVGFALILLIVLAMMVIGLGQVRSLGQRISDVVDQQSRKVDLIARMRAIQQERRFTLLEIKGLDDPFERDKARMHLYGQAGKFIQVRDQFMDLPLDDDERGIWQDIRRDILEVEGRLDTFFDHPAGLNNSKSDVEWALRPIHAVQERMMHGWDRLLDLQRAKNQSVQAYAVNLEYQTRGIFYGMGAAALFIGLVLATLATRGSRRLEGALRVEKEKAERTLDAISDAVIRQDVDGSVSYLNPAARQLLGMGEGEAVGGPAAELVKLFDYRSRQPLFEQMLAQATSAEVVPLATDTRLLNRHGIELEVEGALRAIRDGEGILRGFVLALRDVTESREWMRQQADLWDRDGLTSLPGRRYMENRLGKVLLHKRSADLPMTYLHLNVPGIGEFAGREGREAADALVRHVASLLRTHVRDTDLIARMEEHAFGLLLTTCPLWVAKRIENGIREHLEHFRFEWEGRVHELAGEIRCVYKSSFDGSVDEMLAVAGTQAK